jgi:cytochrome c-type biogenesis protein
MAGDLAFALAAGMLTTVNPCGFAMLPGYLALVAGERPVRALAASAVMTAGFVAVFGVAGVLSAPLVSALLGWLPVVTVVVGLALVVVGVLLLTGRELRVLVPSPVRAAPGTRLGSMFGYGVAFAVASLGCSIGPFLAAAGISVRAGAPLALGAYALGMGLVVAVLAVAAALAGTALVGAFRRALPYVTRAGGALLLVTGAYVGHYGYHELRVRHLDGSAQDPVLRTVATVPAALADRLATVGPVPLLIVLVVLLGLAVGLRRRSRAR